MLRTTTIGSYPLPGWLEFACRHLDQFGPADRAELQDDAVIAALHDQLAAGLDVVTDGEQTRLDFNLSFYGYIEGLELESAPPRRFGPPAHDQRGKHQVVGELRAPRGLGVVEEFQRLRRLAAEAPGTPGPRRPARAAAVVRLKGPAAARGKRTRPEKIPTSAPPSEPPPHPTLKSSVPGPYTLSGRLLPNSQYPDRWALAEALLPIVRKELTDLAAAGCREISLDEPSMSCYAHREETKRLVDLFNRTVESVTGKVRVCTHLCFGNYKGRAVGPRRLAPMFPAFLDFKCDEMHLEMASREFAELELIGSIAKRMDVAVGVVDVKSYYIETPEDIATRVRLCLKHASPDRLALAPDCGLSQTARWAAKQKLVNMVQGVKLVRKGL
jgi:5-methyltetrahydropteroyltriglutamate--homocysteine methyltransferase